MNKYIRIVPLFNAFKRLKKIVRNRSLIMMFQSNPDWLVFIGEREKTTNERHWSQIIDRYLS